MLRVTMQVLLVFLYSGEMCHQKTKMVLYWVTQLLTKLFLVAVHERRRWMPKQMKQLWQDSMNTLTTALQCLLQLQRELEKLVSQSLSSRTRTVSCSYFVKKNHNFYCRRQEVPAILNLQDVITHASHVCSQYCVFVWTSTKNVWNASNALWSRLFGPSITRHLITRVLTVTWKLRQSTALKPKRFGLWSLSPALCSLWLLLVLPLNKKK